MPDLARAAGAYAVHSRISDLRRMGFEIDQQSRRVGRVVHSFYRLADPLRTIQAGGQQA
jgi:biotin operon repressor